MNIYNLAVVVMYVYRFVFLCFVSFFHVRYPFMPQLLASPDF